MTKLFEVKPFIVAEVGSNWETLEHCIQSIKQAKTAGADAVKFQIFTHEALYGYNGSSPLKHELPEAFLPRLKDEADRVDIEFMCTAFSPELVAAVDPYVNIHKVASSDLNYPQLLEAIEKTTKPVLLSTGASEVGEIVQALRCLRNNSVVLMYCVSQYPARTVDPRMISLLWATFDKPVGFSDHTTDIIGHPMMAARMGGAVAIEKHFTAFPELDTPDRPHSLTLNEFALMVGHIRGHCPPKVGPTIGEEDMILRHKCRLVATADIEVGDELRYGKNFGAYRTREMHPKAGRISPFGWLDIEGRKAVAPIKCGESICEYWCEICEGDFG